jgi:hypothetical protein
LLPDARVEELEYHLRQTDRSAYARRDCTVPSRDQPSYDPAKFDQYCPDTVESDSAADRIPNYSIRVVDLAAAVYSVLQPAPSADADGDGFTDAVDNCQLMANFLQKD